MKTLAGVLSVILCGAGAAAAATWYVDDSAATPGDGKTPATAFKTIQNGIDAALNGDTVIVAEGTYRENVNFKGKNIVLQSTDPLDPAIVANTIIDGDQAGSVVTLSGAENETCILTGLTILNGKAEYAGGIYGGPDNGPNKATIRNNVIMLNSATWHGGGLAHCHGTIQNNIITRNSATGNLSVGGGLYYCNGVIEGNLITENYAHDKGGGVCGCSGMIYGNTMAHNSAGHDGGGLSSCHGIIRNCIIWGNTAGGFSEQIHESKPPSFSCIQDWAGGGQENISADPVFVNAAGDDYRLQSDSSCIDVGASYYWSVWPQRDLDGNCRLFGTSVDIGCYEYGALPDSDGDLLSDSDESVAGSNPDAEDTDGDGLRDGAEAFRGSNPLEITFPGSLHVPADIPTIQGAVFLAIEGDEVIVAPGTYTENLEFFGPNLVLRSSDPDDSDVVASTIIDGGGAWGSVLSLTGDESEACVVTGFTIRNGKFFYGGGIRGGTPGKHGHARIVKNRISENSVIGNDGRGGGIAFCDGEIASNAITGNSAYWAGGGVAQCDGLIWDNEIIGNSSLYHEGGGLALCDGTIRDNMIAENSAGYGGGMAWCDGTIQNNIIRNNLADENGGGLYDCDGAIWNNTIVENSTGGLLACDGPITNCIIWGNTGGYQLGAAALLTFSCVEDWTDGGTGNTPHFPYFVDAAGGDYHLRSWSPCIDAGDPSSGFSNEPEPNGGRVNMGAYGNTPDAASKSADEDGDRLPDEWEIEFFGDLEQGAESDPDNDGISNIEEYRRGLKPTLFPVTWYVDGSVAASGDGTSWQWAFKTIQEGIDVASNGDTVIVAEGVYVENIVLKGVDVTLTGTDPLDPTVIAATVIDGNGVSRVVTFDGRETEASVLAGFTIRNGSGGIFGGEGGIRTHATIRNNLVTGNMAGGGMAFCDGPILNNSVVGNAGAGILSCSGLIRGNVIARNSIPGSGSSGGGLAGCNGTIENNIIYGNSVSGYGSAGGGLAGCSGIIRNNTICYNSAETDAGGPAEGGGLAGCEGTIQNCIVWGNTGRSQLWSCSVPTYSCIEGWAGGGEGNISSSPHFVDPAAGNFHLKSWSPCIDAGDPTSPFSEEPELNGGRINMGAYGNTPEATSKSADADRDGLPDDWEVEIFSNLAQGPDGDPDSDFIPNKREYRWGLDPTIAPTTWFVDRSVTTPGDGRSWEAAFKTIQQGVDAASDGHAVVVALGTYAENVRLTGKNAILRSTDPLNAEVVQATVISGNRTDPVVAFSGAEDERCLLMGFTIQNGGGEFGGGINGGSHENPSHATICYNIIADNSPSRGGGGLAFCDGLIENNLIISNAVSGEYHNGGGLFNCDGIIQKNIVTKNAADFGGALIYCDGIVRNNVITGNFAVRSGGGLADCNGTVENNTVYGNAAGEKGGGLSECAAIIRNCIIWGNTAPRASQVSSSSDPTYSCIQGWTGGGVDNIPYYPYFVDTQKGDYHLRSWSPCIDGGDPSSPFSEEPQPNGKRVNMGAYGNTPEATSMSADEDKDGLPDDWEFLFSENLDLRPDGDGDDDGVSNIEEYRRGTKAVKLTWYVDGSVPSSGDGTSWQAAFKTIQEGIDAALSPDIVIVAEGTYPEQVNFRGENITLRSRDPLNMRVVLSTVIDGRQSGPAVSFSGAENEKCALAGFTITNGKADFGGGICGGTQSSHNRSSILNSVIVGNSSTRGGGVAYCDGLIQNNLVIGNSATQGGGLYYCAGIVQNNTIHGNSAVSAGGLYMCHGTVINSIIWGNTTGAGAQIVYSLQSARPRYCCIEGWTGGGEGNIIKNPRFVDADGLDNNSKTYADNDHHLRPDSPCVDAGTHTTLVPPNTDVDGEWRPFGEEIDIGADECVDADADGLSDYWEIAWFGMLWLEAEDDVDADGLSNREEFVRGTDPYEPDSDGDGKSDGDEVFAGTDPRDATSLFRIVEIVYTPWGAAVMWSAVAMRSYRCYFSSGLKDWQTAGGIITAGPSDTFLSVFDWGSVTARTSYYKVEVLP